MLLFVCGVWTTIYENFSSANSKQKIQMMLTYLGCTSLPMDQAIQGLGALCGTSSAPQAIYYAQQLLQSKNLFSGKIDGVTSQTYTSAVSAYLRSLNTTERALATKVTRLTPMSSMFEMQ